MRPSIKKDFSVIVLSRLLNNFFFATYEFPSYIALSYRDLCTLNVYSNDFFLFSYLFYSMSSLVFDLWIATSDNLIVIIFSINAYCFLAFRWWRVVKLLTFSTFRISMYQSFFFSFASLFRDMRKFLKRISLHKWCLPHKLNVHPLHQSPPSGDQPALNKT